MKTFYRIFYSFLSLLIFLFSSNAFAQGSDVEMADTMRQDGKIYVVIAVVGVILLGLIIYLILIDRKVSKMERRIRESDK